LILRPIISTIFKEGEKTKCGESAFTPFVTAICKIGFHLVSVKISAPAVSSHGRVFGFRGGAEGTMGINSVCLTNHFHILKIIRHGQKSRAKGDTVSSRSGPLIVEPIRSYQSEGSTESFDLSRIDSKSNEP
jgi:hypothetical protein